MSLTERMRRAASRGLRGLSAGEQRADHRGQRRGDVERDDRAAAAVRARTPRRPPCTQAAVAASSASAAAPVDRRGCVATSAPSTPPSTSPLPAVASQWAARSPRTRAVGIDDVGHGTLEQHRDAELSRGALGPVGGSAAIRRRSRRPRAAVSRPRQLARVRRDDGGGGVRSRRGRARRCRAPRAWADSACPRSP